MHLFAFKDDLFLKQVTALYFTKTRALTCWGVIELDFWIITAQIRP